MTTHQTSTQRRSSHLFDGRGKTTRGSGDAFTDVPTPTVVNKTKLGIVGLMRDLSRPVTAGELYSILGRGARRLGVLDYHLCTLVRAGVAKVVGGPELRFSLATLDGSTSFQGEGQEANHHKNRKLNGQQ
jgi:hypothetical protein